MTRPIRPNNHYLADSQSLCLATEATGCVAPVDPLRRRLLLGASCSALLSACALPAAVPGPASAVPPPRVQLGDHWRYAVIDRFRDQVIDELTMRVVQLEPRLRLSVTDQAGEKKADELYSRAWLALQEPHYDWPTEFREPNPMMPTVLADNEELRLQNAWRRSEHSAWLYWSEWVDALQWERVQVPAGVFTALRVLRRIAYVHPDLSRMSNKREETLWYAPEVNRWVKREWAGTYLWPGIPWHSPLRDNSVQHQLLEYRPA